MNGITIERNVTSSNRNAAVRTKAKTRGACDFSESVKSRESAVIPAHLGLSARDLPHRGRDQVVAQLVEGGVGLRVVAVSDHRDVDLRDRAIGADVGGDRLLELGIDRGPGAQPADRGGHLGRGHVAGADRHDRPGGLARERRLDLVVGLDHPEILRQRVRSGVRRMEAERGNREHHQHPRGTQGRDERMTEDRVEDPRPQAALAGVPGHGS